MIDFVDVSFGYEDKNILENLNLHIDKGEFVTIAGGNGAGKTTTVKLINGILKPSSGSVKINGFDTKAIKTSEIAKICGFLFQNPDRQICKNKVYDEIDFSLKCVGIKGKEAKKRIEDILKKLELSPKSDPFSLSRGERQKVALASVLAVKPEILILDEPTTGLDYSECMNIMGIVKELNEKGTTIVMVSHDMEIIADFSKRIVVFENGEILLDGECRNVLMRDDLDKISSVLPPQAAQLSMNLDESFKGLFTADEIVEKVLEISGGYKDERIN